MIQYKVQGRWPFPLDMLRYDDSRAATPEDQSLIDRLPDEHCPDISLIRYESTVTLVADARWPSPLRPNEERWKSFLWRVVEGGV